jgi:hypothetical protein
VKDKCKYYRVVEMSYEGFPIRELEICEDDIDEFEAEIKINGHWIEKFELEK